MGSCQAMEQIGIKFKNNEIYVPEVLIAARAMHAGMAILKTILSKAATTRSVKVIVGTVKEIFMTSRKTLSSCCLKAAPSTSLTSGSMSHGRRSDEITDCKSISSLSAENHNLFVFEKFWMGEALALRGITKVSSALSFRLIGTKNSF